VEVARGSAFESAAIIEYSYDLSEQGGIVQKVHHRSGRNIKNAISFNPKYGQKLLRASKPERALSSFPKISPVFPSFANRFLNINI